MPLGLRRPRTDRAISPARRDRKSPAEQDDALKQEWAKEARRSRRRTRAGRILRELPEALQIVVDLLDLFRP